MNLEELRQEIERRTGVPATLLTGETAEENIAQAKALLAFRMGRETQKPKSTAEQFAEWMQSQENVPDQTEAPPDPDAGNYPVLKDGGCVNVDLGDPRTTAAQFAEWAGAQLAFNSSWQ